MRGYFRDLARYNRWANRRLYESCLRLDDGEYRRPRPAFFGSIHATLNHILVGDRAWLGRITGVPSGITALDQELHADRAALWHARATEDERLIAVVDGLGEAELAGRVTYRNMAGAEHSDPLPLVLGHLFNHQTHHRGQVHDQLSQTPVPPPPLDLIYWHRHGGG